MTRKEKEIFRRQFYVLMAMMTIVGFVGWNTPFKCLLVIPAFATGLFTGFLMWMTMRPVIATIVGWGFVALAIYQIFGNLPAPSMAVVTVALPGAIGAAFMATSFLTDVGYDIADFLFGLYPII